MRVVAAAAVLALGVFFMVSCKTGDGGSGSDMPERTETSIILYHDVSHPLWGIPGTPYVSL
jgi:hypothetical protein